MPFDPYLQWLDIPASRRPPTHYDLLGLEPFEATRQQAAMERIAHVRRFQLGKPSDLVTQLLGELSAAFDCLANEARKEAYNAGLRLQQAPPAANEPASPRSPERDSRATPDPAVLVPIPLSTPPTSQPQASIRQDGADVQVR